MLDVIFAAYLTLAQASPPPPPPVCMTEQAVQDKATATSARPINLSPEETLRAIALYDSIPPAGNSRATMAKLVQMADGTGHILIGKNGEYCESVAIPANVWRQVVEVIVGQAV